MYGAISIDPFGKREKEKKIKRSKAQIVHDTLLRENNNSLQQSFLRWPFAMRSNRESLLNDVTEPRKVPSLLCKRRWICRRGFYPVLYSVHS